MMEKKKKKKKRKRKKNDFFLKKIAETAAVSHGSSHVPTKQHCNKFG